MLIPSYSLYGSSELETNAKYLFSALLHESGYDAVDFRGESIDRLVFVENAIKHNIFIYDIDIVDGNFVGELARRSNEMYEKNINFYFIATTNGMWMILTHSSNNSVVPVAIRSFRKREKSTAMLKRVKIEYSKLTQKNVYTLLKTFFDKLDGFGISYNDGQKLFKNLFVFDFESICVPSEQLKDTNTTTWIGKHEPISVSISFNLIDEPVFLCI